MAANIILIGIGILALSEGITVALFPKFTKRITTKLIKNTKTLRIAGIIEIILAIIIIFIGIGI